MQPLPDPPDGRSRPHSSAGSLRSGGSSVAAMRPRHGSEDVGVSNGWQGDWQSHQPTQSLAASPFIGGQVSATSAPQYPPAFAANHPLYTNIPPPFRERGPETQWEHFESNLSNSYPGEYITPSAPAATANPAQSAAYTVTPTWSSSAPRTGPHPSTSDTFDQYPTSFYAQQPHTIPPYPSPYYSAALPTGLPLPTGLVLDGPPSPQIGQPWIDDSHTSHLHQGSWSGGSSASGGLPSRPRTASYSHGLQKLPLPFPSDVQAISYPPTSYPVDPSWARQLSSTLASIQHMPREQQTSPTFPHDPFTYASPSVASSSRPSTASVSGYAIQDSLGGSPPARFARLDVAGEQAPAPGVEAVHPLVLRASQNRAKKLTATAIAASSAKLGEKRSKLDDDDDTERRRAGKKAEHACRCSTCGVDIAKLIFRGNSDAVPYRISYFCISCVPLPSELVDATPSVTAGYAEQLSAEVDRLNGISIAPRDVRPPPKRERATPQRKRRAEDNSDTVFCDVCTRTVGSGGVRPADGRGEVAFGVECVCLTCCERYRRCTDCGGGGGPRIGVGKWRSKELFPAGRKTCQLSHLRLPTLADMSYDIWPVEHLPPLEVDEFCTEASRVFSSHMFATLATPDILETEIAMARTFEELEKFAVDGWSTIEPLLRDPPPVAPAVKRYLALRWATPAQRKDKAFVDGEATYHEHETDETPSNLNRPDKNLAGFVIAELDRETGTLALVLTTPWATGDTFDATTILMQLLLRRVARDVESANFEREQHGLPPYPALEKAWLTTYFRRDSKLTTHLLNRRGFSKLEDCKLSPSSGLRGINLDKCWTLTDLAKYPDTSSDFPRRSFLPPQFVRGWQILARRIMPDDDWSARSTAPKKRRKKDT